MDGGESFGWRQDRAGWKGRQKVTTESMGMHMPTQSTNDSKNSNLSLVF